MFPAGASETTGSTAASKSTGSAAWLNSNTPLVEQWAKGRDSSGYYWDDATQQYVVRMTGEQRNKTATALTASRLSAPVRVETAAASKEAIDETAALVEGRDWYPGGKKANLGFYYDPVKDVTVVQTDAPASAVDALKQTARTPIEVEYTKVGQQSQHADAAPHFGAASIRNQRTGGVCTSGFAMEDNQSGIRYMITAGHCGQRGDDFRSGPNYYGWIANKANFPTYDLAALRCLCPDFLPRIYVGENATIPVREQLAATVGMRDVIVSGEDSGVSGARTIVSTNATLCVNNNCTYHLISTRGGRGGPGDSGAPMFLYGYGGGASGLGVVIGGNIVPQPVTTTYAESLSSVSQAFRLSLLMS
jgi:hypothetical protein